MSEIGYLCRRFTGLAAVLLLLSIAAAQDDVIRVDTEIVTVPVSVLDRTGRYLSTLRKQDFKIFENNIEQQVEIFETVDEPVTLLVLLERTSVRGALEPSVAAANAFVRQMRPNDQLIAVTFGASQDVVIKRTTIGSAPKNVKIGRHALDRVTMLYEAVDFGIKELSKVGGRKAMVIFGTGRDGGTLSVSSAKGTLKHAEESGVTVYTVRSDPKVIVPPSVRRLNPYFDPEGTGENYMKRLAAKTGGRAFTVDAIADLDAAFAEVAAELVRQYSLSYYPHAAGKKGERRRIDVRVTVPGATVRARQEVIYKGAGK